MRLAELVSVIGGVVGSVGGTLGFTTWWQAQQDRHQKRKDEGAYEAFVARIERELSSGNGNLWTLEPGELRFAARAVKEHRLVWGAFEGTVLLPTASPEE